MLNIPLQRQQQKRRVNRYQQINQIPIRQLIFKKIIDDKDNFSYG